KMSRGRRRRLGFERAPHGVGCLGLRETREEEPPEPQEACCHPLEAPDGATNEATMLQKTSVFKKCLTRRFWQDLGKRALDSLRTRPFRGSHSPEGGNSGHLTAPARHSAGRDSPVDAGLLETDRSW
ncbi:MAG TPA: hypothetical protein VI455_05510, partial [Terriglobia bacterium]